MKPVIMLLLLTGVLLFAASRKVEKPGTRKVVAGTAILAMLAALAIAALQLMN